MQYNGIGIESPKVNLQWLPGFVQIDAFEQYEYQVEVEKPIVEKQHRHIRNDNVRSLRVRSRNKPEKHDNKHPINPHQKQTASKIGRMSVFKHRIGVSLVAKSVHQKTDKLIPPKEVDEVWNSKQKVDKKIKSFKLRFLNSYLINFDILKWLNYSIVYAFF